MTEAVEASIQLFTINVHRSSSSIELENDIGMGSDIEELC
jgi:hypothetical protein